MNYKVTALQTVTVLAYVNHMVPVRRGTHVLMKPTQEQEWITIPANQTRDDLGLVMGIHPNSAPNARPVHVEGVARVQIRYKNSELPKEFLGLFRLEVTGDYPPDGGID